MAKNQNTAISVREEMRGSIQKMKPEYAKILPKNIDPDKFERIVLTAVNQNPDLVHANRDSFFGATMKCAQCGLVPDNREAAFVVFKTKSGPIVTFMPMIAGILKMVRNSGELSTIGAYVVHENDEFSHWVDENGEHFKYEPANQQGEPLMVFAFAKTKDGSTYFERMTIAEIEKVRSCSRSSNGGPWKEWWGEMAKKTAIRRLCKRLPMSSDMENAFEADDQQYDLGKDRDRSDMHVSSGEPNRLKSIVSQKSATITEPADSETVVIDQTVEADDGPPIREPGDDKISDTEMFEDEL